MTDEQEVELWADIKSLVSKAKALVDMLDDAERNHGGLYAAKTMTASNELRLELSKWGAK